MRKLQLKGVWAPVLTPFCKDHSVNFAEYERLVHFILSQGVHGVFIGGTTGEFVNLTIEERQNMLLAARRGAGNNGNILYNVTAMNLEDMHRLMEWGKENGADAFSVTAPYYHRYDSRALVEYFKTVARLAENIPVYLYNMSGMTNNPITTSILKGAVECCENICGIKDSSMDFMTLLEYREAIQKENFQIVTGNDAQLYYALCAGADGGIIAVASVFPEICVKIWEDYQAENFESARYYQNKVMQVRNLFRSIMPVMSHKRALELRGFEMGEGRFPFRSLTEEEKQKIDKTIQEIGIL